MLEMPPSRSTRPWRAPVPAMALVTAQMQRGVTKGTNGMGVAGGNFGEVETFTTVLVTTVN